MFVSSLFPPFLCFFLSFLWFSPFFSLVSSFLCLHFSPSVHFCRLFLPFVLLCVLAAVLLPFCRLVRRNILCF